MCECVLQNARDVVCVLLSHKASTGQLWSGHSPLSLAIASGNDLVCDFSSTTLADFCSLLTDLRGVRDFSLSKLIYVFIYLWITKHIHYDWHWAAVLLKGSNQKHFSLYPLTKTLPWHFCWTDCDIASQKLWDILKPWYWSLSCFPRYFYNAVTGYNNGVTFLEK